MATKPLLKPIDSPVEPVIVEPVRSKRWYIAGVVVMTIAFIVTVGWFLKNKQVVLLDPSGGLHVPTVTPTPTPKTIYSTVLLGSGGAGHEGGELTDTMMLVRVDTTKKEVALINIPRDIWVAIKLKGSGTSEDKKINFAFWAGGPDEMKRLIEMITGVPTDTYVSVDFSAFEKLVDILGGLDVEVPTSFVDNLYPIAGKENETCGKTDAEIKAITATMSGLLVDQQFPCRYERIEFTKGKTVMDGATALKFVRSRHSSVGGGDFARGQRQQAVIEAIRKKVFSLSGIAKLPNLVSTAKSYIHTDAPIDTLVPLATTLPDFSSYTIKRILISTDTVLSEGTSVDHQYILFPKAGMGKWDTVRDYVKSQL